MNRQIIALIESLKQRPGLFLLHPDHKADRLQAFLAGIDMGAAWSGSQRAVEAHMLREYQRWLSLKLGGPDDTLGWFDVLRSSGSSDDEIIDAFVSHFGEYLVQHDPSDKA